MRNFSNTAVETELVLLVSVAATQITVKDGSGYPLPPFTVIADPDMPLEEVMLVLARNGLTWDVVRGWGGTTAVEHAAGAKLRHGAVAEDFREGSMAFTHLFGAPIYNPTDPTAPPANQPLLPPGDVVRRSDDTWGGLL